MLTGGPDLCKQCGFPDLVAIEIPPVRRKVVQSDLILPLTFMVFRIFKVDDNQPFWILDVIDHKIPGTEIVVLNLTSVNGEQYLDNRNPVVK